jgi:CheY-like chemotaxis protein
MHVEFKKIYDRIIAHTNALEVFPAIWYPENSSWTIPVIYTPLDPPRKPRRTLWREVEDYNPNVTKHMLKHMDGVRIQVCVLTEEHLKNEEHLKTEETETIENVEYAKKEEIPDALLLELSCIYLRARIEFLNSYSRDTISTIAHKIRTPLNTLAHAFDPQAAAIIANVVTDAIDITKINLNLMRVERSVYAVKDLVDSAIALTPTPSSIQSYIAPNVPSNVLIDTIKIRQILITLLNNAQYFSTCNTYIDVSSNLLCGEDAHDINSYAIQFTITDTGPGIAPQDRSRNACESYLNQYHFEPLASRVSPVGFGLQIAKKLARLMGGNLWIEKSDEHGTVFILEIITWEDLTAYNNHSLRALKNIRAYVEHESWIAPLSKYGIHITRQNPNIAILATGSPRHNDFGPATVIYESADGVYTLEKMEELINALMSQHAQTQTRHDGSVLIVEDIASNAIILEKILRQLGYDHIDCKTNGQYALDHIKANPALYQTILVDIKMPVMNGFEFTQLAREFYAEQKRSQPRFISVSAEAGFDDDAFKIFDARITKPIDVQLLSTVLKKG